MIHLKCPGGQGFWDNMIPRAEDVSTEDASLAWLGALCQSQLIGKHALHKSIKKLRQAEEGCWIELVYWYATGMILIWEEVYRWAGEVRWLGMQGTQRILHREWEGYDLTWKESWYIAGEKSSQGKRETRNGPTLWHMEVSTSDSFILHIYNIKLDIQNTRVTFLFFKYTKHVNPDKTLYSITNVKI